MNGSVVLERSLAIVGSTRPRQFRLKVPFLCKIVFQHASRRAFSNVEAAALAC